MIEEYSELVLSTYKKMRDNAELSLYLLNPTPAKLKRECLRIYSGSRYDPLDDDTLSLFFDVDKIESDFDEILSTADPDLFRPLINHINERTVRTDEKNIELLAWLIDFKPRPRGTYYKHRRENIKSAEESKEKEIEDHGQNNGGEETKGNSPLENLDRKPIGDIEESTAESNGQEVTETIIKIENEKEPIFKPTTPPIVIIPIKTGDVDINEDNPKPPQEPPLEPKYVRRFSLNFITISCIIFLFVGSSSFVAWERSATTVKMPAGNEKCMYWNVDHYEPIDCKKQVDGATIIPLDLKALEQQRKINLPDTLTSYSLGKVWYKGFMKDHEFFTAAGTYPTDTARVLKRLTPTILAKYISNSRYLLTRLTWLSYATVFVALCGFGASRLKKKVKPPMAVPEVAEEETIDFTQPQAANC